MNGFFLEDCSASPDQISFVPAVPWRGFVVAMKGRDRAHKNEIAISVLSETANNFPHDILPLVWTCRHILDVDLRIASESHSSTRLGSNPPTFPRPGSSKAGRRLREIMRCPQ
jgi:hypothetical protein